MTVYIKQDALDEAINMGFRISALLKIVGSKDDAESM